MQPNLSLALNLPPEGALRYFDSLNLPLPANAGEAIAQAAAKARSIAGIQQQEIVGDLFNSLRQSAADGTPFATWRKNMLTMLRERGLALDKAGDMVQQSTGEVVGTGLTRHRLQTIYRTNMTNARMASLWQKLQENKDARPYLQYSAINDMRTRKTHLALDDLVYPIDDPFWDYFYPPNGFRCRCHVIALAPRDVARAGLTVSHSSPEQFSEMVITNRKGQSHTRTRITLADGRSFTPDKGFDNNVGKNHLAQLGQLQMERAVDLPPRLASMAVGEALKDPAFSQISSCCFKDAFQLKILPPVITIFIFRWLFLSALSKSSTNFPFSVSYTNHKTGLFLFVCKYTASGFCSRVGISRNTSSGKACPRAIFPSRIAWVISASPMLITADCGIKPRLSNASKTDGDNTPICSI